MTTGQPSITDTHEIAPGGSQGRHQVQRSRKDMIDRLRVDQCRDKLIATARARSKITYGDLAKVLHVANQSVGLYLNAVYEEEIAQGRPDLTVVVVYPKTGMGRFNSRGGPAQSVVVDAGNPEDVRAYTEELNRVYDQWN
jgi:hypothetical protein